MMHVCAVPEDVLGLTAEKLRDDGIFLWENGAEAILWLGPRVPLALQQALIGWFPLQTFRPRTSPCHILFCIFAT